MKKNPQAATQPFKVIARHLTALKQLNSDAGGVPELDDALSMLARYLALTPQAQIRETISASASPRPTRNAVPDVESMTPEDVSKLVAETTTPRAVLESIAIRRFGVPSGSMRSFPNVKILREKLQTLADNERAHDVISAAAKRGA